MFLPVLPVAAKKKASAQYDYFNGAAFWQRMKLEENTSQLLLSPQDTAVIIATTRGFLPDSLRFLTEQSNHKLVRFFLVYARGGYWHVRQTASLSEAKALLPSTSKDWVVYTEGMGKIFTSDADRGMRMAAQYGVNVLLLDYPSIRTDKGSWANYYFARNNAVAAYKDFLPQLDSVRLLKLAEKMGSGKLTLFFHSMGNKVVRELMLGKNAPLLNQQVWVDNIVLNAPCVIQKNHRRWLEQVAFARHIYVHYNPEDFTLKWARLLSLHKQLGDRVRKPVSSEAVYINFNTLCGRNHSNFLSLYGRGPTQPEALAHYSKVLHGDTVAVHSRLYAPSVYRGIGWDILP